MLALLLIAASLSGLASAQTCDATLSNWPNTNRPTYCCPYAGEGTTTTDTTRTCQKIQPYLDGSSSGSGYIEDISQTSAPNPCYWTNLAGQTPDTNSQWNSPAKNFFVTIGPNSKPSTQNTEHQLPTTPVPAYYAQVKTAAAGQQPGYAECLTAQTYYTNFNTALNRYNCEEQYSHWNCDDCRKAYARWAAAMALPACALEAGDTAGGSSCKAVKPCIRICNEVVQKCPVTLGFTCPTDNRDYSDAAYCETLSSTETSFTPATYSSPTSSPTTPYYTSAESSQTLTFTAPSCCNPMGLQNAASSLSASLSLLVLSSALVALLL